MRGWYGTPGAPTDPADDSHHGQGSFYRAQAQAIVLAGQMHSARRMAEENMDTAQLAAAEVFENMPATTASVVVNNSQFLGDSGVGYDFYWYGNEPRVWQDAIVADWAAVGGTPVALDGTRPNVLTFYGAGTKPFSDSFQERLKLLNEPFSTYEDALRDDLNRIFAGQGLDFDRDVSAINLHR